MLKRGMNKKAQEGGASAASIVGWVILAVLLVIIILAISGFFNPILEKFNYFPGSGVAALVKACDSYVQLSSKTDYCSFRQVKVDGKTEYVNCMDTRIQNGLASENRKENSYCESSFKDQICKSLISEGVNKLPVLSIGNVCIEYTCEEIGGTLAGENECPANKAKKIAIGVSNDAVNNPCCVTS